MEKGQSLRDLRRETKKLALRLLRSRDMPLRLVLGQLCNFNDWKIATNRQIIDELEYAREITLERKGNDITVRYNTDATVASAIDTLKVR